VVLHLRSVPIATLRLLLPCGSDIKYTQGLSQCQLCRGKMWKKCVQHCAQIPIPPLLNLHRYMLGLSGSASGKLNLILVINGFFIFFASLTIIIIYRIR
jgi:hypothetical protein